MTDGFSGRLRVHTDRQAVVELRINPVNSRTRTEDNSSVLRPATELQLGLGHIFTAVEFLGERQHSVI